MEIKLFSQGYYVSDNNKPYLTKIGTKESAEQLKSILMQTKNSLTLTQKVEVRRELNTLLSDQHNRKMLYEKLGLNPGQ